MRMNQFSAALDRRVRAHIERDIAKRQAIASQGSKEAFDGWE
jgi:hypothetical protein